MKEDKTMNETIENLSSENALQTSDKPEELTELFVQKRKTVTLLDTLTIQAILCVIAAIGFVTVNIFDSGLAYDIFGIYSEKSSIQENISDTFRMILDFLKSRPVS